MMENVIEIETLRKEYKGFTLGDISFNVPKGYVTGLIGPNGAGKTTIIRLIMNLARRKRGAIRVFGLDNIEHGVQIRDRIGFVYDTSYFYEDQRLDVLGRAIGPFYSRWDQHRFESLIEQFQLSPRKTLAALSKGMKTKFALALALSHDADLIVMDEPTTGLDPLFRRELLEMLREVIQNDEKSILFSRISHRTWTGSPTTPCSLRMGNFIVRSGRTKSRKNGGSCGLGRISLRRTTRHSSGGGENMAMVLRRSR